jgi:hypothetical protein
MAIPYRTRRRLQRFGSLFLSLLILGACAWLCWVIWVERYIIYTEDGAVIDFDLNPVIPMGEIAQPPVPGEGPEIHYNEGENAVNTSTDLLQMSGFYITYDLLKNDFDNVKAKVQELPTNTPVMIDVRGGFGSFYYSSSLEGAVHAQSVNVSQVDELIQLMHQKNLYMIARFPAFQDYTFALNHVASGIPFVGGGGALWMDEEGCYWLKPRDSATIGHLTSIILELKNLGFDEVVLDKFWVPTANRVQYTGDAVADLQECANRLVTTTTTNSFTVSFTVSAPNFTMPEGRCRMYLTGIPARDVEVTGAQATVSDPKVRLVFIADSMDTRFDTYGVLRTIDLLDSEE